MNISGLLTALDELESYRLMREDLRQGEVPAPLGLMRAARAPVLSAIARDLSQEPGRPLLVVAGTTGRAQKLVESLRDWSAHEPSILRFPEPLTLFYDRAPWTEEIIVGRLRVLSALYQQQEDRKSVV